MRVVDESGMVHGLWTVIERVPPIDKNGAACWRCRCRCGKERVVRGVCLRKGTTASCGCVNQLEEGEAVFNAFCYHLRLDAASRGYECSLTKEQIKEIIARPCHYCAELPRQIRTNSRCRGSLTYNGIDRIDNQIGYVTGNIRPCCKQCNYAKRDLPEAEFIRWIRKIHANYANSKEHD